MKIKSALLASAVALSLGSASVTAADLSSANLSVDGGDTHYGVSASVSGVFNSVGFTHIQEGGDNVSSIDYRLNLAHPDDAISVHLGLSGIASVYGDDINPMTVLADESEMGYALGAHVGFGLNLETGTSFYVGLTEEIAETRFEDGQIFEASVSQEVTDSVAVRIGYRKVDRELDGEKDTMTDSGFAGLEFTF